MKSLQSKNITSTNPNRFSFFNKESNQNFFSKSNNIFTQRKGFGYSDLIQTQVAANNALLTNEQINRAIRFNGFEYPPAQLRMLQHSLQITETGRSNRETALTVAQYQQANNLTVDGMAGPDTFAAIHADAGITDKDDLIIFSVEVADGISLSTGGGTTDMLGHFKIEIHLPPGNCDEYEYRQFICGEVEFLPAGAGASTPFQSLNNIFTTQPGGSLPHIPNFHEDGNTSLHRRFGHRDRPATPENKYVNENNNIDQQNGCTFLAEDFPGITRRITNPGETYDFDIRFFGEVRHKTRGRVTERWWNVRSTFVI